MKILIFGATGTIGSRILQEALRREHEVTMVVRDPSKVALETPNERLRVTSGDLLMPASVADAAAGHDVVISAYGPRFGAEDELLEVARSLVEGVKKARAHRLIIVGGAGSLEAQPGVLLMDSPGFPEEVKPLARAHAEAYEIYKHSDIDWTYLSPPPVIQPGERSGMFRIGTTRVILDELDNSQITAEDFAVALLDEVEDAQFIRERFTVAY